MDELRDTQYNLPIGTDCISRKQAIEAVQNRHMMLSKEKVLLINDLEKLPSAQPKRGKWVLVCDNNGMHFICNKCGAWRYHQEQKFCGECGAKMEVTT